MPCPLCRLHPDGQAESFHCADMKKLVNIRGKYEDIFSDNDSSELIQTVYSVYSFREEYRKMNDEENKKYEEVKSSK